MYVIAVVISMSHKVKTLPEFSPNNARMGDVLGQHFSPHTKQMPTLRQWYQGTHYNPGKRAREIAETLKTHVSPHTSPTARKDNDFHYPQHPQSKSTNHRNHSRLNLPPNVKASSKRLRGKFHQNRLHPPVRPLCISFLI